MRELSDNIVEASGDGVNVSVQAIPLAVDLDFAIPVGLLVTELLTNSIRHAFPSGKGDIAVILQRSQDGKLALIVSDNGQGQTNAGVPPVVRKSGLGAKIISGLVAQLGGTMTTRNENGTRTEICIAEPVLS
jgi:two-component sensor histidine kinase